MPGKTGGVDAASKRESLAKLAVCGFLFSESGIHKLIFDMYGHEIQSKAMMNRLWDT